MTETKLPLSVVILTHRSDKRFEKALSSAQKAQEVLVIDYQSQNDWKDLQKKYTFSVVKRTGPIENFSFERNFALKQAHHDWVFFLDSDEIIPEENWLSIEKCLSQNEIAGFWVHRKDVFYGKELRFGETGNQRFLRLIQKEKAEYLRPVHEKAEVTGKTATSKITLLHFSHQNISEFIQDITRYASMEAEYQNDNLLSDFSLGVKTILYPKAKFLSNYFLKLGFFDGWRGLVYAVMMSLHSLMVRVFSYENT